MPTHNRIAVEESATVTARVATVQITRGTTNEQQEILIIGDPDTSNALAAVTSTTPESTSWGLIVRPYGYSTIAQVSSVGGVVTIAGNSTAVIQGNSTVAPLSGSTWNVRPVQTSQADNRVTAYQSTAGDFNVTVAGYSTTAQVSSVGGVVTIAGNSTVVVSTGSVRVIQSTAGDLNVTVAGYSTIAQVSSVGGIVAVRVQDSSGAVAGFHFNSSGELITATAAGGSTEMTLSRVYSDTGGYLVVGDSTNNAVRVNVVAGSAAGDTSVTVSTGSVRVIQSTAGDLNVTVAGYSTTAQVSSVGGVVTITGASTVAPLAGSTWSVRPIQTSQADLRVTAYQSTAADFNVTVAGYSTTVQVSSLAGAVQARIYDSSGTGIQASTGNISSNVWGLVVRQAEFAGMNGIGISTAGQTTLQTVVSSVAATRIKVFAYSVTSTAAGPVYCGLFSSNATTLAYWTFATPSSAISGISAAVSPPAFLFQTAAAEALTFRMPASSIAGGAMNLNVSYFTGV